MNTLSIIIDVVLILISLGLILVVLMQQGQREGLGAIAGGAETFFGKNASNSAEGKLKKRDQDSCVCVHCAGDRRDDRDLSHELDDENHGDAYRGADG